MYNAYKNTMFFLFCSGNYTFFVCTCQLQSKKSGLPTPGSGLVVVSSGGLVLEWGKNEIGDQQVDRGSFCSDLDTCLLWLKESRAKRQSCWFTDRSTFLPSPIATKWGSEGSDQKSKELLEESPFKTGWEPAAPPHLKEPVVVVWVLV